MLIRLLALFIVIAVPALAAGDYAPKKLGVYKGWHAYETKQAGRSICYMVLRPAKQEYKKAKNAKRSDAYLMITFRPAESMNPVVSYRSGYIFKQGSEVIVNAGDKPFNLFTERDQAWARSGAMDIAVTKAVRKAKGITVQGISSDGGKSSDSFTPDGAENAYKAVVKACGIT